MIRDGEGVVMGMFEKTIEGNFSVEVAELLAIREGLKFAFNNSFKISIVESDSARMVKQIQ